jgi:DnaK suppressor protein
MNNKEMQSLRSRIEKEITELRESVTTIKKELRTSAENCATSTGDILDCAKDERDLKAQIGIYNHCLSRFAELSGALNRMDKGKFGICEECGDPIGLARLHARPGATLCIGCQEFFERSQVAA